MEKPKTTLSDEELMRVLYDAGFRSDRLKTAFAVAKAESSGRPKAYNPPSNNTGDDSYGIFQINMIGNLGPDRRERYQLERNEDLFDPARNARVAFQMSNKGKDWGAWTTYTKGRYKQFLKDADKTFEQFKNIQQNFTNVQSPRQAEGPITTQDPVLERLLSMFKNPYEYSVNSARELITGFRIPGTDK
jgi:hypothetical protein